MELDVRGARCPVPYVRARTALPSLAPGEALVVLTTDPEASIDLGALALREGMECRVAREADGWLTITLHPTERP